MGLQRVGHDWATELNWTDLLCSSFCIFLLVFSLYQTSSCINSDSLNVGWYEESTLFANTCSGSDVCGPHTTLSSECLSFHLITWTRNLGIILDSSLLLNSHHKGLLCPINSISSVCFKSAPFSLFPLLPALFYPSSPHGEGNGTPLQYSCLENPMDGEAW